MEEVGTYSMRLSCSGLATEQLVTLAPAGDDLLIVADETAVNVSFTDMGGKEFVDAADGDGVFRSF
ncbi:hypothetical protein ABTX77_30180 [Streptomyces sp. NPDC097704]|uniref:hypothetical protein n=1 Tax=Streptomyces sp. NPDC097704 TaxID=3157101 RepID=UPI00332317E8